MYIRLLLLLVLLGSGSSADAANAPVSTTGYFPAVPGSVYHYRVSGGSAATATVMVTAGHTLGTISGLTEFAWQFVCNPGMTCGQSARYYWRQDPAGLGWYGRKLLLPDGRTETTQLTVPAIVLPPSVVPGTPTWVGATLTYPDADMWSNTVAGASDMFGPATYTAVYAANTLETVTVPAGTFVNALQVYENRGGSRRNLWFAPGVGLLKSVELNYPEVTELVSFMVPGGGTDPNAVTVVEFYHAALDHYFITATADEISKLDSGYFQGWARTGYSFRAIAGTAPTPAGASPVCRFYGNPVYGLDSHFYSASPEECAAVKAKFPEQWIFESDQVFQVYLPNTTTGACPAGTVPVYRSWNNRRDSNHRYTTNAGVQAQMIAKGYIAEGYGNPPVVMCAFPS